MRLRIVARGLVLAAVWLLAAYSLFLLAIRTRQHHLLRREVMELEDRHTAQMEDYSGALAEGQRLKNDPGAQVSLLKDKMGYARTNEVPIVVSIEEPAEKPVD